MSRFFDYIPRSLSWKERLLLAMQRGKRTVYDNCAVTTKHLFGKPYIVKIEHFKEAKE